MKSKEVINNFNHLKIESELYKNWERKGLFNCNPSSKKKKFSIVMPPPNVTGTLHIGHALNMTLQDIICRYWRMNNRDVLWQPGTDHAGIATQSVVEKKIYEEEKIKKNEIGKEKFISEIWKWKNESGEKILNQIKSLGASPDWNRIKFTLDKDMSEAVNFSFKNLYDKGLIYKDKRLINWDIKLQTAISDLEVEQKEQSGIFVYLKYKIENSKEYITVATTRPETLFGDCCIAVSPLDKRYKKYIGKKVTVPLTNKLIPVIEDEYVDMEKGTGALKVTPAHDFNDYKLGKKHKLKYNIIFDKKGKFNSNVPEKFKGLDRLKTRDTILEELKSNKLIEKIENIKHKVPYGDRSGIIIEPYLTDQWFLDVKALAKEGIKLVNKGKTNFYPKNWTNTFHSWMKEIEPWCISRQIWWGHQIPVWYGPSNKIFVETTKEAAEKQAILYYGKKVKLIQDNDVLDTWFSSSLWPMSTLGWPKKNINFKKYFPTDLLITGFDIIFFWVARMIMQSINFTKVAPFKDIYIHALVRDKYGQKMSKSKGNVIDPLVLIEKFGADPLRLTLSSMAAQGRDIRLSEDLVKINRNFITKICNAYNFLQRNLCLQDKNINFSQVKGDVNIWIISKLNIFITNLDKHIRKYRFNDAAKEIYKFTKNIFCDWYLELAKIVFQNNQNKELLEEVKAVINFVFKSILKLSHPFIPFLTDYLFYEKLESKKYLLQEKWPEKVKLNESANAVNNISYIIALVSKIRNVKFNLKIDAKHTTKVFCNKKIKLKNKKEDIVNINSLARIELIDFEKKQKNNDNTFKFAFRGDTFFIKKEEQEVTNNSKKDTKLIRSELKKIDSEIIRLENKLKNENFVKKAPSKIVNETKLKLKKNLRLKEKMLIEI